MSRPLAKITPTIQQPRPTITIGTVNPSRLAVRNRDDPRARGRGVPVNDENQDRPEPTNGQANEEDKDAVAAPVEPTEAAKKKKKKPRVHPQEALKKVWKNFEPEFLGKLTRVLPELEPALAAPKSKPQKSQNAAESYREARAQCESSVKKIVVECKALNQKYTDVHFDLERDLKVTRNRDCIDGLVQDEDEEDSPFDVKRVTDLFDNPKFFADGASSDDIIQGGLGDCWLLSAFAVLSCSEVLINRVCVIQDQDVGVYGFVFFRDGEWHPTIIDDKLYLSSLAFDEGINTMLASWGREQEQKYQELFQRGSKALYFARCRDDNETWVPLLEKALAKAHGGYDALRGGQTGEGVEDLTGGVTTEIYTQNILSKDRFWKHELTKIGKEFVFDATDAMYREWMSYGWDEENAYISNIRRERRRGIIKRHAYAVLDTYEGFGERLVKVRNPWGEAEWTGPWSDGAPEWTPQWLERLDHKFGDDGVFWMSYKDFLSHYKHINRTRIFDESWFTAQKWASIQVPFSTVDYQQTKFTIDVPEDTETVIVLSQLDSRYFCGLEGPYDYTLQFRISKSENEDEYIARSRPNYELERSTNVELKLEKGQYTVLIKVEATNYFRDSPEKVIGQNLPHRKEKVTTIGRLYDLAHQKGLPEPEVLPTPEDSSSPSQSGVEEAKKTTPETTDASATTPAAPVTGPLTEEKPKDKDGEEEEEEDPEDHWNASCVVGLRVYSKLGQLAVNVIWPPKLRATEQVKAPALDRDAITKAPQDEAQKAAEKNETEHEDKDGKEKSGIPKKEEYAGVMSKRSVAGVS